jgi:hypothetical protein
MAPPLPKRQRKRKPTLVSIAKHDITAPETGNEWDRLQ